jgi:addiction module HigA family antidote
MKMMKFDAITPGEILDEEFIKGFGISAYKLAKETKIPATRISEIIKGKRKITVDTALRFSKYFGNSAEFWLNIQNDYDLRIEKNVIVNDLNAINKIQKVV